MDEKDKKTRKIWLISLVSIIIANLIYSLSILSQPWFMSLILVIVSAAFLYAYYRCAYKKPGTKFLIFSVILSICSYILNGILWLKGMLPFLQPGASQALFVSSLFFLLAGLWILVLNVKMIGVNKRIQAARKT